MFLLQSQSETWQKTVAAYQLYLNVYFVTLLFVLF